MTKGVFIDDDSVQQDVLSALLSQGGIDFSARVVPSKISFVKSEILRLEPDIIVMDYRLDDTKKPEWDSDFRAGGLAQVLRETFVDTSELDAPIILLSTEANIKNLFAPDRTSHDLFDLWYLKSVLQGPEIGRQQMLEELNSVILAYRRIKELRDPAGAAELVRSLLGLEEHEFEEVQSDGLKPMLLDSEGKPELPHVIARYVLHSVVKRAGILLSELDIRARLGVSEVDDAGYRQLKDAANFGALEYQGIFHDGWPRYWRHRFDRWLVREFTKPFGSLTGEERVAALNARFGLNIEAAKSRWSGSSSEYFAVACRVCSGPTELRHSVAVFEARSQAFMERGRICYDCVNQEVRMKATLIKVAETDEHIVQAIREGKLTPPGE